MSNGISIPGMGSHLPVKFFPKRFNQLRTLFTSSHRVSLYESGDRQIAVTIVVPDIPDFPVRNDLRIRSVYGYLIPYRRYMSRVDNLLRRCPIEIDDELCHRASSQERGAALSGLPPRSPDLCR